MSNNIAFKLFVAILIISSTVRATEDLDFDTLSDPSHNMPAVERMKEFLTLSQKDSGLAEQCLDEAVLVMKGEKYNNHKEGEKDNHKEGEKYKLSKGRAINVDEKRVVAKVMAAYIRLFPTKKPFDEEPIIAEGTDESISERIKHHFSALKAGFNHISDLMSGETEGEVEVFGVPMPFSDLALKSTVVLVEPVKLDEDDTLGGGKGAGGGDPLASSKDAVKPTSGSSLIIEHKAIGGDKDETDVDGTHKSQDGLPGGSPAAVAPEKSVKTVSKEDVKPEGEEGGDGSDGRKLEGSSSTAVLSSDGITPPPEVVEDAAAKTAEEEERKRKEAEAAKGTPGTSEGGGGSSTVVSSSSGQAGAGAANANSASTSTSGGDAKPDGKGVDQVKSNGCAVYGNCVVS